MNNYLFLLIRNVYLHLFFARTILLVVQQERVQRWEGKAVDPDPSKDHLRSWKANALNHILKWYTSIVTYKDHSKVILIQPLKDNT